MSIVTDAVDAIQSWFNGVLADGIVSSLNNTCSTLSSTFDSSNVGIFKTFLKDTPNTFTGKLDGSGTPVWSEIETITNSAVVPIAMFILVVVLLNDLIQTVISGNNFRDFDTAIFVKWAIKAFCGILLVSNVFYIATGIFSIGSSVVNAGISAVFPDSGSFLGSSASFDQATLKSALTSNLSTGDLIIVLILSFLTSIVTFIVLGVIILVLANRIIEVFMYLSIAPIPMATVMNNDWGQIGKNWLRNILALAFQGFFIIVAMSIFKVLLLNVISTLNEIGTGTTSSTITSSMALMLGFIIALIFTILRSGNISKSIFSAH